MAGQESFEQTFNKAVQFFEKGKLQKARKCLGDIQRRQPDILQVLHLLSLIELQSEQTAKAVGYLEKAVRLAPKSAEMFGLLGTALIRAGRPDDALAALGTAIGIDPGMADAQYNMGNTLRDLGRNAEAAGHYRQAIHLEPEFADAHFNLGWVLKADGNLEDAARAFGEAARINPGDAEALMALGTALDALGETDAALSALEHALQVNPELAAAHYNFGNVLGRAGRSADAVAAYRRALDIEPDGFEIHSNLGEALLDQNNFQTAITHFQRANEINPGEAEVLNNLGTAYRKQGNYEAALDHFDQALAINPFYVIAQSNKANALGESGRPDEALECHRDAVENDPDNAVAHHNLALQLLLMGQMREGWREYEWRWRSGIESNKREYPQPQWQGDDPAGKTILVWSEQGAGDEILFAGMIPALLELGVQVIMECDARLAPVFERSFPGVTAIPRTTAPDPRCLSVEIDFQIAAGSLGQWLRGTTDPRPGPAPYLAADRQKSDALKQNYKAGRDVLVVGVTWNSINKQVGNKKSLNLSELAPLAGVDGIVLVDLQYGDTRAERDAFAAGTRTEIVHDDAIDQMADLDTFAAQVAAMDLVISVSNTTAHFAGALGMPTWVMLHPAPLPCWLLDRDDSPWYPSVQLFRQSQSGEWADVVERVVAQLLDFHRNA